MTTSSAFASVRKCCLALAAALLFATCASMAENIHNQFGDWSVDCDDNLFCNLIARDVSDTAEPGLLAISISRDEGWRIWMSQSAWPPDPSFGISFIVHETPLYFPPASFALRVDETGSGTRYALHPLGGDAERMLSLLGTGRFVNVDFTDCHAADHTLTFRQSGLADALAWVKKYQGGEPVARILPPAGTAFPICEGS